MVLLTALLPKLKRDLNKMVPGESIEVRTWKNDRGFLIQLIAAEHFELHEDGFQTQSLSFTETTALLKALKPIIKREFPRSRNCRYRYRKELL